MKKTGKLTREKLERIEALRRMMQNPLMEDLKKITGILRPSGEPMLLEVASRETGISEDGIKTTCASTKNELEIFSEEKGGKEIWYIRIKKKQPQSN